MRKEKGALLLFDILFWVFLSSTVLYVLYFAFVPDPNEWPGEWGTENPGFPDNFSFENLTRAILRHLSLFPQHFQTSRFIDILNVAFLAMFVYRMRQDLGGDRTNPDEGSEHESPKSRKKLKIPPSTYIDWAIGAPVSGIIFVASRLAVSTVQTQVVHIAAIFVFCFVSYYLLYPLRRRMQRDEQLGKRKTGEKEGCPSS